MGTVVDLQSYRLGIDVCPIQLGADKVTRYFDSEPIVINDSHWSYDLLADHYNHAYSVGTRGLADFQAGLNGVFEEPNIETASEAAGILYGAYYVGRMVLPEVMQSSPFQSYLLEEVVDSCAQKNPDADLSNIAELVAAKAAASMALLAVKDVIEEVEGKEGKERLLQQTSEGRLPAANKIVQYTFKHHFSSVLLGRLIGRA